MEERIIEFIRSEIKINYTLHYIFLLESTVELNQMINIVALPSRLAGKFNDFRRRPMDELNRLNERLKC